MKRKHSRVQSHLRLPAHRTRPFLGKGTQDGGWAAALLPGPSPSLV